MGNELSILSFNALDIGAYEDEYVLVAYLGRDDPYQYVTFQRDASDTEEDWGVHFEFNDQINGAYDCITRCLVKRDKVHVRLTHPIDWQKQIQEVEVTLEGTDSDFESFVAMLRRIFRERESILIVQ
jgi:hypothetical protein